MSIDLAARLATADQRPPLVALDFASAADGRYLVSGWYPPRRTGEQGGFAVWTDGPVATLELPVERVENLRLELWLRPPPAGATAAPEQRVTLRFNDTDLGRWVVRAPSTRVRVRVPAELQHPGVDTLMLLPHWFGDAGEQARQRAEPRRGLRLDALRVERPRPPRADRPATATTGGDVLQPVGGRFASSLQLPAAPTLRLGLRRGSGDGPGRVEIGIATDAVPWTSLFRAELDELASTREIALDLGPWSEQAVTLTFLAQGRAAAAASRGELRWIAPRIEGLAAPEAPPAGPAGPRPPSARPSFLVVLFDTLRADFTEPYHEAADGAPRVPTPHMRRLAERGVTFTRASANAPSTRSSTASLLTGLYPDAHTVTRIASSLPGDVTTLAGRLARAGYRTVGVSNNAHVSHHSGLSAGFQHFGELYAVPETALREEHPRAEERAAHVWQELVEPGLAGRGEAPFFVYLHEIDPHFPYDPLPPFDSKEDAGAPSALLADPHSGGDGAPDFAQVTRLIRRVNEAGTAFTQSDIHALQQRYAGEVAYVDAYLGGLLDELARRGLAEETVVILLSDHGEQFFEHGLWTHGRSVYREDLRVPFVLALPDGTAAGQRVETSAELVDLAPTVLALAGVEAAPAMQGRSLLPALHGGLPERAVFARGELVLDGPVASRRSMVRAGRWKLHRTRYHFPGSPLDLFELYDLARDPGEQREIGARYPTTARWLRELLAAQDAADAALAPGAREAPRDPETIERLRALGYLE